MYIFVKENITFTNFVNSFFEDTLSFLYNVNNAILFVFHLEYRFMSTIAKLVGISFGKYLVLLTMIHFNMSE